MLLVYLVTALAAHIAAPVARALSRAAMRLALALDDARATTLALAFGRTDRRTPSGERRASWGSFFNEYHQHFHEAPNAGDD
jgi:hypothetical protein